MPTFYNFRQNGVDYSFDDVFIPADLFRDGNLWTWGEAFSGRLGEASFTDKLTPVTTFSGGINWKQLISGSQHIAAIKTDGTLWIWGESSSGRLGTGNISVDTSTPATTFAGGTDWKQVSAAVQHTAAIKTDGTLWIWGTPTYGKLGDSVLTTTKSTPVTTFAGGTNWKQVSCGQYFTSAIKTDGTLWTWGAGGYLGNADTTNRSTPVTTFAGGNNWKQVSSGGFHVAAIKTDGTLWTWGFAGGAGYLGNTETSNQTRSTPITTFAGGTNWKQVNVGSNNVAAIKTDGTLWTWGIGSSGQLGNADTTNRSTPVTTFAGGNNWKQVSSGGIHTAAIKADGTLWIWGNEFTTGNGNNNPTSISTPITTFAGRTNWRQVSCGDSHTAAVNYNDLLI
jgi:alpha-tubulin suppressor-like RCC1 family protein